VASRRRILYVTKGFEPVLPGGVEVHARELVRALGRRHEISVLTRSTGVAGERVVDGVRVHAVDGDGGPANDTATLAAFESLLTEAAPEVVHVDYLWSERAAASRALLDAAARRRVPTVLALHDYWYLCPRATLFDRDARVCAGPAARCGACMAPWPTRNPLRAWRRMRAQQRRRLAFRGVLDGCSLAVAVSAHVRDRYLAAGACADRIVVVPPGIRSAALATPPPAGGPLGIAFLGRLQPEKGAHVLLEALARVGSGWELDIWGPGERTYVERLRARAAALPCPVRLRGEYEPAHLDEIVAGAHVVVVPSQWPESFGLVAAEALVRGRLVVASRVGGLADQIVDGVTGTLVPPGNAERLGAALGALVERHRAGETLTAATPSAVRTIDAEVADWDRLYELLAAAPDRPAEAAVRFDLDGAAEAIAGALGGDGDDVVASLARRRRATWRRGSPAARLAAAAVDERSGESAAIARTVLALLRARRAPTVLVANPGLGGVVLQLAAGGLTPHALVPPGQAGDVLARRLAACGVAEGAVSPGAYDAVLLLPGAARPSGAVLRQLAVAARADGGLVVVCDGRVSHVELMDGVRDLGPLAGAPIAARVFERGHFSV